MGYIAVKDMPKRESLSAGRVILSAIGEFYKDEENIKAFEEWKKQRKTTLRRVK